MNAENIVAIGASAGGLAALEEFFQNLPEDLGAAYVVVQHLSSEYKSVMDDILKRFTAMPVKQAKEEMTLEENAVYLIPPGKMLTLSGKSFHLEDKDSGLKLPINVFFKSLADSEFKAKVGVILSGSGTDGSEGLRHICEQGGIIIAQSADSAEFDSMPNSALETGLVEVELAPSKMGFYLRDFFNMKLKSDKPNSAFLSSSFRNSSRY